MSCLCVTPACTVASRSPGLTRRILSIREISIVTPPRKATTLPSKPLPLPKGIIGTLCRAQILTIALTSSVRLREGNGVRRYAGMIRGIPAMLLAHQFAGRQTIDQSSDSDAMQIAVAGSTVIERAIGSSGQHRR